MPYTYSHYTAAATASANRFVTTTNMIVGAYTVAVGTMPTDGARKVTVTHTTQTGADTLGTITITGTNLAGQVQTEAIVPLAGTVATGTKFFKTVTAVVGAGWVINGGNDTIVVGCDATQAVLEGGGTLHSVVVNTTAAGTVTLADARGTMLVLKASIAEGSYVYDIEPAGFLTVTQTAASDITVVHSYPTNTFG